MTTLLKNKKIFFNYEIMDEYDAGLKLKGSEVKALRSGQGSLEGAFVVIRGGEAFLLNANIHPLQPANVDKDYDPSRPRKILLTKKEIDELVGKDKSANLTIVPISVHSKGRWIKLKIASVRGKKKYDKRQAIKKREAQREVDRTLKQKFK
jgi:SsrA-binding protein